MLTFPKLTKPLEPCCELNQLLPSVRPLFVEFEKRCAAKGLFLKRVETYRDPRRSNALHKANPKAAAAGGKSMHNYRVAVDYCINSKADAYNVHLLTQAGKIWQDMGHRYVWGGDWNGDGKIGNDGSVDMPHFQIVSYSEEQIIRALGYSWDKIEAYIKARCKK
jgi:hypothetical protein